jgi:hypothetical protein
MSNRREISASPYYDQSHYLHPHPYEGQGKNREGGSRAALALAHWLCSTAARKPSPTTPPETARVKGRACPGVSILNFVIRTGVA